MTFLEKLRYFFKKRDVEAVRSLAAAQHSIAVASGDTKRAERLRKIIQEVQRDLG